MSAQVLASARQNWTKAPRLPGRKLNGERDWASLHAQAARKVAALQRAKAAAAAQGPPAGTGGPPENGAVVARKPFAQRLRRLGRRAARRARDYGWRSVVCAGVVLAAAIVLLWDAGIGRRVSQSADAGSNKLAPWPLLSAREWFERARARATAGNFRQALGTVKHALVSSPKDADLLVFEGDMQQSLFQFIEAQRAYEQALHLDADNPEAQQNLQLCRRINRYRDDASSHRSTLYGLHRVMLGQNRVSEAVAISRRLNLDQKLRQTTWQAALTSTGLAGTITVDADGGMEADLSGNLQPDLSLLKDFPLTSLKLADTGLEDLHALQGMPLKKLDLTRTLVHNLAPLRRMPLQTLLLRGTGVVELSDIDGCPLRELDISDTRVDDLSPLARMPLESLRAVNTPVADLRPLATRPLTRLDLARTRVSDLRPLENLGLLVLSLDDTRVTDLAPLRGCRLRELHLSSTGVSDLRPLAEMPLTVLTLSDCGQVKDLRPLRSCSELEHLQVPPHPQGLDQLAVLPRLRFLQPDETRLEDMLLLTDDGEQPGRRLEEMMLLTSRDKVNTAPGR